MVLFVKCKSDDNRWTLKFYAEDFPVGSVTKSLPANVEVTGSIPDLGRFHMPQGNKARVPQLLKPVWPRAHALQQEKSPHEKPMHHNKEQPLLTATRECLSAPTKTKGKQKNN